MTSSAVTAGMAIAVTSLLWFQPGLAGAQSQPDPGDIPETAAGIEPFQSYAGAVEQPADVDMYSFRLASAPASVGVDVTHTNDVCEIWAVLVAQQGTQSQEVFVPRRGTMSLRMIAPVPGTYYVRVTTGPLRSCAEATYALELSVETLPLAGLAAPNPAARDRAALSLRDSMECYAACARAATLGELRRKLIKKFHHTTGAEHRRVGRRLRRVTKRYRRAQQLVKKRCD
jgi:hypothetical protein